MMEMMLVALLLVLVPRAADSQYAEFGFWSCVALCTKTNYKFTSPAGQGCRTVDNCATAFAGYESNYYSACSVSDPRDWAYSVTYTAVRFADFQTCKNYANVVSAAETAFSDAGVPSRAEASTSATDASDAACSCNSVVNATLTAFVGAVVPESGSATDLCKFAIDMIAARLTERVLPFVQEGNRRG